MPRAGRRWCRRCCRGILVSELGGRAPRRLFVDESKSRGLLLAAACVSHVDTAVARERMRSLLLPGQRRVHFTHEKDGRRRSILAELSQVGLSAFVVTTPKGMDAWTAREQCLREIAGFAVRHQVQGITVERDDSVASFDRRVLYNALHRDWPDIEYRHERAYDEPLLWAADAIAWSWAKGGVWRDRVRPLLMEHVELGP